MFDTRSDQERIFPECDHKFPVWYTAPSLLETIDGITYVYPRWNRYHRRCKACHRLQVGKMVKGEIVPIELLGC